VVTDSAALYGSTSAETMTARLRMARQLGATGATEEALALTSSTLAEAVERLGAHDPVVYSARFEVAVWTRRVEGALAAARLYEDLLEDLRAASAGPRLIMQTGWNVGGCLLQAGDADAALPFLETALAEAVEAYGELHMQTMLIRFTHVNAVAAASDGAAGIDLARRLADDAGRVLGDDHTFTTDARALLADLLSTGAERP